MKWQLIVAGARTAVCRLESLRRNGLAKKNPKISAAQLRILGLRPLMFADKPHTSL
jgi:hypothetical protein